MKALLLGTAVLLMAGCKPSSEASEGAASEVTKTRHLSADEYEGFIATPGKVSAVMFHADWCGPCHELGPVVEEVVEGFGGQVVLGMIDVDDSAELAKSLGVNGIPDLRLFRNGVMVDAMKGAIPEEQVRSHFTIQVAQLEGTAEEQPKDEPAIQPMKDDWRPPGVERR